MNYEKDEINKKPINYFFLLIGEKIKLNNTFVYNQGYIQRIASPSIVVNLVPL